MTTPALILLSGLPGSGKTTFARELARRVPLEHIESDHVRRNLCRHPSYSRAESAKVFSLVASKARLALRAGGTALVDATNLATGDRERFVRLAVRQQVPLVVVRLTAPPAVIRERLAAPRSGFSQAGSDVYEHMLGREEHIQEPHLVVDTRYPLGPTIHLVLSLRETM